MKIFELFNNYDYQSINFVSSKYLELLFKIDGSISVKDEWEFAYIKFNDLKLKKIQDFSLISPGLPVFRPRAIEILKDFFISGELLLLKTPKEKEYYLYNIFPEIDCLDINNPNLVWNNGKHAIFSESKPTFIKEKIDRDIFKTKYMVTSILVTDKFVQRVLDNNLLGFQFIPLWDSETGYIEDVPENRIIT